jgi:hypothetical protein
VLCVSQYSCSCECSVPCIVSLFISLTGNFCHFKQSGKVDLSKCSVFSLLLRWLWICGCHDEFKCIILTFGKLCSYHLLSEFLPGGGGGGVCFDRAVGGDWKHDWTEWRSGVLSTRGWPFGLVKGWWTNFYRPSGQEKKSWRVSVTPVFSDQVVAEIGVLSAQIKCRQILEKQTQEQLQFMCTI